jgi:hypothetical protein
MNPDYAPIINLPFINFANAYWFVGDDETQVYSSKRDELVSVGDPEYDEWQADHATLRAASLDDLKKALGKDS